MARPFAVFDIDGTLIRWQLYHAVVDELVRSGHMDKQQFQTVRQARMEWKRRAHQGSFNDYEQTLIKLFDLAITSIKVSDLEAACGHVIEEYKDQVYTYTRDMIKDLRSKNYLIFGISGSPQQIVKMLADYYDFDDYGGSTFQVKDGRFTGDKEVLRLDRKPAYLKELALKHGATWQGSIGVGDSEGDIAMLATVEQPIAFNPNKLLFDHARTAGWQIVVERKNVIYKFEATNEQYLLAQADN